MAQRDWMEKDYYKVLGVDKTATKDEIKKAYRKLAQKHHPDANKDDASAETRFKEISEAHAILSNDEKRREYDQIRQFAESGGRRWFGFDPSGGGGNVRINIDDLFGGGGAGGDVFEDLLGGFGFRQRGPQKGRDLETERTLTFDEAVQGTTVSLNGTNVRIPPGVTDGARIRVAGKGGPGPNGGPAGDLYVRVRVEPHEIFSWTSSGDLEVVVPVTIAEAALGGEVEVPTLDGSVRVKVPAGSQTGKKLRVRGRGAPKRRGGHGDLIAKVDVAVPSKLTKEERKLLEQFSEVHKGAPRKHLDDYVRKNRKPRTS